MSAEENVKEPQVVEPETGVARPIQPFTITDLANMQGEEGLERIEKAVTILKTLRRASIALTHPQDWVLFKADNRVTGYLQDVGVERIWPMWGIEQFDLTDFERTDDKETADFAISISGSARCKLTGQVVEMITGTRYSYEDFIVKRKLNRLQIEPEVRKAARRNLDGNQGRELMGMKSVPIEELDEVWQAAGMTWKSSKFCALGRGFGTAAERQGAQVQQADDLQPGEEPLCEGCEKIGKLAKMKFVAAGVSSRTGKSYDAFWSCTTKDSGHKSIQHSDYMKLVMQRREAGAKVAQQRQPGEEG